MDPFTALDASTARLRQALEGLKPDQLAGPSICPDWTVRDLANHVIGGADRYALLIGGADEEALAPTRTRDYAGDDPVAVLDRYAGVLRATFSQPGALERTAAHRAGDVTGSELLGMRVIEQALHAWDIAESAGASCDLGDDLCDHILQSWSGSIDRLRDYGFFGTATDSGGPTQRRLLTFSGRTPSS